MIVQSSAALALTALAVFVFRAGGLVLAERLGPRSPVLAWANAVSYSMLAVYVVQTLLAPGSSLQATPTAARIAAALLAVAGFTALGRGLFQWLVIGTAAFSLGLGPIRTPELARTESGTAASNLGVVGLAAVEGRQLLLTLYPPEAALFATLHHPAAFGQAKYFSACGRRGARLQDNEKGFSTANQAPLGLHLAPLCFESWSFHLPLTRIRPPSWSRGRHKAGAQAGTSAQQPPVRQAEHR